MLTGKELAQSQRERFLGIIVGKWRKLRNYRMSGFG